MARTLADLKEGVILNSYYYRRIILSNKNVLEAVTGPTGSGKSYLSLKKAELWYAKYFNEPFPDRNICFTIEELLDRLNKEDLRKGELLIYEEAGTTAGSLDFQTKATKVFNYVLQSFRSLNIGLIINLPYFSMLNKQSRMLMHILNETQSIDKANNQCVCKTFLLQVNQDSGKIYKHYPRVVIDGEVIPIERFGYTLPSKELRDAYEKKKHKYVMSLISGGLDKIKESREDKKADTEINDA